MGKILLKYFKFCLKQKLKLSAATSHEPVCEHAYFYIVLTIFLKTFLKQSTASDFSCALVLADL